MLKNPDLFKKYNCSVPRYTSFPAYPYWNKQLEETSWIRSVKAQYEPDRGIDLYVHVPYCHSACFYCGCNKIVTRNQSFEDRLVENIITEWNFYLSQFGVVKPKIASLHLGGGTPTFLTPKKLNELLEKLGVGQGRISIEIDPRNTSDEHIEVFQKYNLKRVSLGIQDFDPDVQKVINRVQPYELVETLVKKLRKTKLEELNFDLIYGLPLQDEKTIIDSCEKIVSLSPDTIAFFSYAHLPSKFKAQRSFEKHPMKLGQEKYNLFLTGSEFLAESGYQKIGLDHFAKKSSIFMQQFSEGKIERNFMGYVSQKSNLLIGLGPSSISSTPQGYVQNCKDVSTYYDTVESGVLPIESSHKMSLTDQYLDGLIQGLMVTGKGRLDLSFLGSSAKDNLDQLIDDGLLKIENDHIEIEDCGKHYLRNICAAIDPYFQSSKETRFSSSH